MNFKAGDVVMLKSGGPKMTVEKISPDGTYSVACSWFEKEVSRHGNFAPEALMLVQE